MDLAHELALARSAFVAALEQDLEFRGPAHFALASERLADDLRVIAREVLRDVHADAALPDRKPRHRQQVEQATRVCRLLGQWPHAVPAQPPAQVAPTISSLRTASREWSSVRPTSKPATKFH
jgi:hypothetical protein